RREKINMEITVKEQTPFGEIFVIISVQGNLAKATEVIGFFKKGPLRGRGRLGTFFKLVERPGTVLQQLVLCTYGEGKFLPEHGLQIDLVGQVGDIKTDPANVWVTGHIKISLDQRKIDLRIEIRELGVDT